MKSLNWCPPPHYACPSWPGRGLHDLGVTQHNARHGHIVKNKRLGKSTWVCLELGESCHTRISCCFQRCLGFKWLENLQLLSMKSHLHAWLLQGFQSGSRKQMLERQGWLWWASHAICKAKFTLVIIPATLLQLHTRGDLSSVNSTDAWDKKCFYANDSNHPLCLTLGIFWGQEYTAKSARSVANYACGRTPCQILYIQSESSKWSPGSWNQGGNRGYWVNAFHSGCYFCMLKGRQITHHL